MKKKHTIHILGIKAVNGDTFDLPDEQNAIILCTDTNGKEIYGCLPENILNINFPDVTDGRESGAFSEWHARRIIDFVGGLSDEVTDIYVCCTGGESRSPAVAAALLKMSQRSDKRVWKNPYYKPNTLVYSVLCREYGFKFSRIAARINLWRNTRAFKQAQKSGSTAYERWELLD